MKVRRMSKVCFRNLKCPLVGPNIIYSNSKIKVTCKNADFECWYIRTHTKEKPSKISNIAFTIFREVNKNSLLGGQLFLIFLPKIQENNGWTVFNFECHKPKLCVLSGSFEKCRPINAILPLANTQ